MQWQRVIKPKFHIGIPLRISLALFCILTSITLAYALLISSHNSVHAAPTLSEINTNGGNPWGIGFDNAGNAWVALPNCDPSPFCGSAVQGSIEQVSRANFNVVHTFGEPGGFSSPVFVAVDSAGNIWFTEPMNNAIGELTPSTNSWQQWNVPTSGAGPYDLAFDASGNLWFTEINASKIGEFSPVTHQFNETPTPTSGSMPYGIVGPDPSTGQMWFTENPSNVARIGSFVPPTSGALSTPNVKEYLTNSGSSSVTPHLITFDHSGNIWWSEGWDKDIGKLVISQAVPGTKQGVTEYGVPACSGSCAMHISGIGVDSAGTVWFDDSLSGRVGSFVPSTNTFSMISLPISSAHPHDGLAVDSSNNVFVAEEFANKLAKIVTGVPPGQPGPSPTVSPSLSNAPVNKTWYFAEGRIGNGFREYLTIDNPNVSSCTVDIQYNYTPDGHPSANKLVTVSVRAASRLTELVNGDLGFLDTGRAAASLSTVVTVNGAATPACNGVVVERPMYFASYRGIFSGTDVIGATHLSNSYYFADVPTGPSNSSYLTILNPNNASASVTATYYYGGKAVGSQSTSVNANARGTIAPGAISLPSAHVAAIVTSNQQIMVERPTYFTGQVVGGTPVYGAYDIVGVPTLANDWLFAEGYTSSTTQEYLTIANIDPARTTANVTVALKSKTGAIRKYTLSLSPQSQILWNVNIYNLFVGSSPEVSVEVTSSGANIVVQREMYFTYRHTIPTGRVTTAIGGTDVIGQVGPATHTAYSFAEGYSNTGYNQWLTIQNPTNAPETLTMTMVNGLGQRNTQTFTVGANSRYTQDISAVVQRVFNAGTNSAANSVSMTVTAANGAYFVAERPMYWNTTGLSFVTTGGGDVIGYVGG